MKPFGGNSNLTLTKRSLLVLRESDNKGERVADEAILGLFVSDAEQEDFDILSGIKGLLF